MTSTIVFIGQQLVSEPTDLKVNKKDQNMSRNKYESIRIPLLNKVEYPTRKVKMMLFLEGN